MLRTKSKKTAARDRLIKPEIAQFREEFLRCWICSDACLLSIHDIASGAGRREGRALRENWLYVCCDCHSEVIHGGEQWHTTDKIAREYALKRLRDPKFYDRPLLNSLRGKAPDAVSAGDVREATAYVKGIIKW